MSVPPEDAAETIRGWFQRLPPQSEGHSISMSLPGGRNAPGSDSFVIPTRIGVEGDEVVIDLDTPMQLRFRGLGAVTDASETLLRLDDYDELEVSWGDPGQRRGVRYRDDSAAFVSGHLVGRGPPEPYPEGVVWENPI